MQRKFIKAVSMIILAAFLTGSLGACKKNDASSSTSSASTASNSAQKSSGTTTKGTGTASSSTKSTTAATTTAADAAPGSQVSNGSSVQGGQVQAQGQEGNTEYTGPSADSSFSPSGVLTPNNLDLKGRSFVIAKRGAEPDPNVPADAVFLNSIKNAEQKYNTKVEWRIVSGGTGQIGEEYVQSATAGLYYADVLELACKSAFPMLVEKNLIVPINDYIDFNSPVYNTKNMRTGALWKDKVYGLYKPVEIGGFGVFFNKDIMQREGISNIYEMVDSGSWNWDSFLQVAQTATKDLNGDGMIDQWGSEMHKDDYPGSAFLFSNGADYFSYVNGRVEFSISDEKAVKALQFMSDLVNVYKVMTPRLSSGGFNQGGAAMFIGGVVSMGNGYLKSGMNYGFIPLPKGPDVSDYQIAGPAGMFWGFPTNANYQENIPVFLDMMTIWDPSRPEHLAYSDYNRATIEKHFMPEDYDFVTKYFTDRWISQYQSVGDLQKLMKDEVFNKIVAQQTTPASALESVKIPAQQILDNLIDTQ